MSNERPAVPRPLARRLKEESGYRCAIPTCGQKVGLELAHIEPWATVQEHVFENMICLCSTCHIRFDVVKDIPKLSILHYKRNLSLLSHRYTQVENQVIRRFAKDAKLGTEHRLHYAIHEGMMLLFQNLIDDQIVEVMDAYTAGLETPLAESSVFMSLTDSGVQFVSQIVRAEELEGAGDEPQ